VRVKLAPSACSHRWSFQRTCGFLKVPEGIKGATSSQGDLNDPVSGSRPEGRGSASKVVSELDYVCIFQAERKQEEKENTLVHISLVSEAACRDRQKETDHWNSVVILQVCSSQKTVKRTVGDAGSTQGCRVTTVGFLGR
jgi:hypothetical protein